MIEWIGIGTVTLFNVGTLMYQWRRNGIQNAKYAQRIEDRLELTEDRIRELGDSVKEFIVKCGEEMSSVHARISRLHGA